MAKVTFGPIVSDARGKIADTIFTRARGGNVARSLSRTTAVTLGGLLPIANGDTPGVSLIGDPSGQPIGVAL
jgi:hypothetical protein